jgi:hypothetical protein
MPHISANQGALLHRHGFVKNDTRISVQGADKLIKSWIFHDVDLLEYAGRIHSLIH